MKITTVANDPSLWLTLKESSQIIIDTSNFIKTLFTNPMTIVVSGIHAMQPHIMYISMIVIAVIILLKMIGFKDMEKWGILSVIVYIVINII